MVSTSNIARGEWAARPWTAEYGVVSAKKNYEEERCTPSTSWDEEAKRQEAVPPCTAPLVHCGIACASSAKLPQLDTTKHG